MIVQDRKVRVLRRPMSEIPPGGVFMGPHNEFFVRGMRGDTAIHPDYQRSYPATSLLTGELDTWTGNPEFDYYPDAKLVLPAVVVEPASPPF